MKRWLCIFIAVVLSSVAVSPALAQNLLKKLDMAQARLDSGKVNSASGLLQGFIEAVEEQAGETIDPLHAEHLIQHAQLVITALSG